MKVRFKLTLPLWVVLLVIAVVIAGIVTWVYLSQILPDQVMLSNLTVEDIASVTVLCSFHGETELNKDQIKELVPLLNQVELLDEPWNMSFIGGACSYRIQTKDGTAFIFLCITSSSGYYSIDGRNYLVFGRGETPPELFTKLEALPSTQCHKSHEGNWLAEEYAQQNEQYAQQNEQQNN